LWTVAMVTSLLTAIYMFRVVFLTFHGTRHPAPSTSTQHPTPSTQHPHEHLHDAPPQMAIALVVLAVGSVLAGYAGLPHVLGGGDWLARFLEPSFHVEAAVEESSGSLELLLMALSSGVAIAGIGIAAYFFLKNTAAAEGMAERFSGLHRVLMNKY